VRDHVYRICEAEVWAATRATGELPLSELDRKDGFVHLSSASQIAGTLARYFAGREDLVVLTIACDRLVGGTLRFEPPGRAGAGSAEHAEGELFPHFYGRVCSAAIIAADELPLDEHGRHRLPAALTGSANCGRIDL
jgi:uncharacterized protein (DUF952 family)